MTDLRTTAQQLLGACEQRLPLKGQAEIIDELNNLRAALAEPRPIHECYGDCPTNPQTCPNPCNFEGRPRPVQEPVAYTVGRTLHWHQGRGVTDAQLYIVPPQRPAESKQDVKGCDHCNHPMYAAIKCRVCGRVTSEHLTPGSEHLGSKQMAELVQEPVEWSHINGTSDTKWHPPQRKPLAEWQINDLIADIDPEDVDSWSFRQGVYAAEKHHGVKP